MKMLNITCCLLDSNGGKRLRRLTLQFKLPVEFFHRKKEKEKEKKLSVDYKWWSVVLILKINNLGVRKSYSKG